MYQFIFYVPSDYVEVVKNAVFDAGAGKIGTYERCSWEIVGLGQFKPLEGSNAFIGQVDELTKTEEVRVEMVCEEKYIKSVIQALQKTHPYEEPAFSVMQMCNENI